MADEAGLRRDPLSEWPTEAGLLGSSAENSGREPAPQQHFGFKSGSLISQQCVIGFVVVLTVCVLVFICGISLVLLDPVESSKFGNNTTHSSHPELRKANGHAVNQREGSELARLRRVRMLASQAEKTLVRSRNCVQSNGGNFSIGADSQAYHSPRTFYEDFLDMACNFKIFVYPHSPDDPFVNIFKSSGEPQAGNYASEYYFKTALLKSDMLTEDPAEADLFYLPFSVVNMRGDDRIGAEGVKHFLRDYVSNISAQYPYWDRSGGADHFYVTCHSIGITATDEATHVRNNTIQVVCSASYQVQAYYPHKDATIPQVWPRTGFPTQAPLVEQRTTLAFYAGVGNSPVRAKVAKHWANDSEIKVYAHHIQTPYDEAFLTSKFCLHVKGFAVNTARLADAMHYGCVPVIIANHHDLPFNDVLDWSRFSLVVETDDIPKLKDILKAVSHEEYLVMQRTVMQVRQHFQWHAIPQHFDAFYMVMYELWLRRHVTRFQFL